MANALTKIERIEFIIQDEITICNLYYSSTEPGTPWGGGWKTKSFGKSKTIVDFLNENVAEFLLWPDGREGGAL